MRLKRDQSPTNATTTAPKLDPLISLALAVSTLVLRSAAAVVAATFGKLTLPLATP